MNDTTARLRAALHRVTLTVLAACELHGASADLVDQLAEELVDIVRPFLDGGRTPEGVRGRLALERLLDALEAADAAETIH